jgi:hypothetical protein
MVHVFMVDSEFAQIFTGELASTAATDPREKAQCLLTVTRCARIHMTTGLGNDPIEFAGIDWAAAASISGWIVCHHYDANVFAGELGH